MKKSRMTTGRSQSDYRIYSLLTALFCIAISLVALTNISLAKDKAAPEYMKLDFSKELALEIKGDWDSAAGVFRATDIELLPQMRSPKLRAKITAINTEARTVTVFGREIAISDETVFVGADSTGQMFSQLRVGLRVELSCKAKGPNAWTARKIKIKNVKSSDKIKSGIQRSAVTGTPPDTLEVFGLKIILNDKTDLNEPTDEIGLLEIEMFDYAGYTSAGQADEGRIVGDKFLIVGKYRGPVTSESEYDLTLTRDNDLSEMEPTLKGGAAAYWSPRVTSFAQLRLRKRMLISNDRNPEPTEDLRAKVTQLYTLFRNVGTRGLSLAIGRQDIEDSREWMFDEYLDAVRVLYYGHSSLSFEGAYIPSIVPTKSKFESWTDLYFKAGLRTERGAELKVYMLKRSDTSLRNREPVWWGASFYGDVARGVKPWFDYAIMRGEDKGLSQSAWALDLGVTMTLKSSALRPAFTVGYAAGSGDKNSLDSVSNEFRQSSYEDNVAQLNGASEVHYYGEAFNPELSNLKVFTIGAGFRPFGGFSVEALYHTYNQHELDNSISGSDLIDPPAQPNGASDNLGSELDIIATSPKLLDRLRLRWTLAVFTPGDAYAPRLESALLSKLDLDVQI